MEGVVLVEKLSGSLVFTRSFTDAFDLRHPRSERMNLSALLFALLNFAGELPMLHKLTSGRLVSDNSMDSSKDDSPANTTNAPSISMFATPQERIVLAQTPSRKLFVALFIAPTLDADVTKSLVRRLAYNCEHGDSLENRIAVVVNQGPRLFRDALRRSIEEQVDELLESFATQQLGGGGGGGNNSNSSGSNNNNTSTHRKSITSEAPSSPPAFILFYFSDHLRYKKWREFDDNSSDRPEGNKRIASRHASTVTSSPLGALGFRSPLALGSGAVADKPAQVPKSPSSPTSPPPRPDLSRAQSNLSMRSVYASTRSLFPNPPTRDIAGGGNRKIKKKKAKKNAVMDHAEPQMFQRVVHLSSSHQSGNQTSSHGGDPVNNSTDAITYVVVPFLKQVIPLFFTGATKPRHQSNQQQNQQQTATTRSELKHMSWKNFALEPSSQQQKQSQESAKANTTDLVAWEQGNCLIIYPESNSAVVVGGDESEKSAVSESARLRRERERKTAVIVLFETLEPLVQALMIGRT